MWKLNQYWMWSAFAIWKEDIIWKDDKITFSWGNPDTRFIYSCFTMGWNAWLPWVFLLPCVETVLWKNLESPLLLTGYIYRHGPLGFEYIIYRHIHSPSIYTTQQISKQLSETRIPKIRTGPNELFFSRKLALENELVEPLPLYLSLVANLKHVQ